MGCDWAILICKKTCDLLFLHSYTTLKMSRIKNLCLYSNYIWYRNSREYSIVNGS